MNPIEWLDRLFASIWRPLLRCLCSVTGWSNFRWARIALVVAGVLIINGSMRLQIPLPIVIFAYTGFCLNDLNDWRRMEEYANELSSTLTWPFPEKEWMTYVRWRLVSLISGLTMIAVFRFGELGLGMVALGISEYFASDFHPRSPSWLSRTVRGILKAVGHIRLRLPLPQPHPA